MRGSDCQCGAHSKKTNRCAGNPIALRLLQHPKKRGIFKNTHYTFLSGAFSSISVEPTPKSLQNSLVLPYSECPEGAAHASRYIGIRHDRPTIVSLVSQASIHSGRFGGRYGVDPPRIISARTHGGASPIRFAIERIRVSCDHRPADKSSP